jgi:hypothetical protein
MVIVRRRPIPHPNLQRSQLDRLAATAARFDPEKRAVFYSRVQATLRQRGNPKPADHDLDIAIESALKGLRQTVA